MESSGLAIGYYLSKRNFVSVEIIERDSELSMHASGHNAGGLAGVHESQPRDLLAAVQKHSGALSGTGSIERIQTSTTQPGARCLPERLRKWTHSKQGPVTLDEAGVRVEFLDSADLQKREPNLSTIRFNCGLYYPADAQGNSKKLGQCFARTCLEKGMEISTGSEVISF